MSDENTTTFKLWPTMVMVEGPSNAVGILVGLLYDDPHVARDSWTVTHRESSRKRYAEKLKSGGHASKRQGIGVKDHGTAALIQARAKSLGLSSFLFSSQTTAKPAPPLL